MAPESPAGAPSPHKPSAVVAEELYQEALTALESLSVSQTQSGPKSQKKESPLLYRLARNAFSSYWNFFLQNEGYERHVPVQKSGNSGSQESSDLDLSQTEIPKIRASDSASHKRAKAVRLLEIAGHQLGHASSLWTLGNMYLVRHED